MNAHKQAPRLLGAAFLLVVLTSLVGGLLLDSVTGSGSVADILVNVANNVALMRISILVDLLTSLGVIVLAALLYTVLSRHNKIVALVALGWWLAEALSLALSKTAAYGLIPLSQDFVRAGAPDHATYQALGTFLYDALVGMQGQTIHMFFYCAGGILWYSLFYRSRAIPRAISLFGLIAVSVASVGIVFQFLGYDVPIFVYLPILPFEVIIGVWLLLKGIAEGSEASSHWRLPTEQREG
ncbi:MAG: DUF4386 domain-containing protein [Anaerolineae bacterium]|jgi:hypothetical protein